MLSCSGASIAVWHFIISVGMREIAVMFFVGFIKYVLSAIVCLLFLLMSLVGSSSTSLLFKPRQFLLLTILRQYEYFCCSFSMFVI